MKYSKEQLRKLSQLAGDTHICNWQKSCPFQIRNRDGGAITFNDTYCSLIKDENVCGGIAQSWLRQIAKKIIEKII